MTTTESSTVQLTCRIPNCGAPVTAQAATDAKGRLDIDVSGAREHAAEHTEEEARFNDLIPTWFHCGVPWEHEEHVYLHGEAGTDQWVCPGITWQETGSAGV
ncbi:hypothetical protein GCM10009601_51720 [Streptomyces thermospinosisporus]|uniref:Uncharacterized protein n=1 Tax=Streptomyces thermospinosisporus TaxID=161482 RepID=A0ABN1Z4S7_9ACTN